MPDQIERELAAIDDALAGRPVPPDLTELGELALLLREERPEPGAEAGRRLDARMQRARAGAQARRSRGRRPRAWLLAPGFGVALAAVLGIAVLTGGGDSASSGGGTQLREQAGGGAADEAASGSGSSGATADSAAVAPPAAAGSPGSDARQQRSVERSAALTLVVPAGRVDPVSARVQSTTRRYRGFVSTASVSATGSGGYGTFTLRIPTAQLDAALADLARLGTVRERSQEAQDITAQTVSARDRLADARAERRALLRQLDDAGTPAETTRIRRRLNDVAREIAAARAAVRRAANRADFATVTVTVTSKDGLGAATEDEDGSWGIGDAARDAGEVLQVAGGILLFALVILVPLGLLALPAAAAVRHAGRRRRARWLDAV